MTRRDQWLYPKMWFYILNPLVQVISWRKTMPKLKGFRLTSPSCDGVRKSGGRSDSMLNNCYPRAHFLRESYGIYGWEIISFPVQMPWPLTTDNPFHIESPEAFNFRATASEYPWPGESGWCEWSFLLHRHSNCLQIFCPCEMTGAVLSYCVFSKPESESVILSNLLFQPPWMDGSMSPQQRACPSGWKITLYLEWNIKYSVRMQVAWLPGKSTGRILLWTVNGSDQM